MDDPNSGGTSVRWRFRQSRQPAEFRMSWPLWERSQAVVARESETQTVNPRHRAPTSRDRRGAMQFPAWPGAGTPPVGGGSGITETQTANPRHRAPRAATAFYANGVASESLGLPAGAQRTPATPGYRRRREFYPNGVVSVAGTAPGSGVVLVTQPRWGRHSTLAT